MKKKSLFILSLLLSLFITAPAFALNLGSLVTEDAVANNIDKWWNPAQSNITGAVLEVYMPILMQLGGILLLYTMIVGTLSTAHDGEMLGKKWSSVWIPIRTAIVPGLLYPVFNGYSSLHMVLLFLILQGNTWGNDAWKNLAPRLITDNSFISVDNKVAIRQMVMNTLYSAACVNTYNEYAKKANDESRWGKNYNLMGVVRFNNDKMVGYTFGIPRGSDRSIGYGSDLCGSTKLKLIDDSSLKSGSTLIDTTKISKAVQEAQIKANDILVLGAKQYADILLNTPTEDADKINKQIDLMVNAYSQYIQASAEKVMKESLSQQEIDKLTEKGWTYSYTFYSRIANAVSETNAAVNRYPATAINYKGDEDVYFVNQFPQASFATLKRLQHLLTEANKLDSNMSDSSQSDDGFYQKVIGALGGNMRWINDNEASKASSLMPLSVSINLGSRMIIGAEATYLVIAGGATVGGSIPFLGNGVQTAAIFLSPLLNGILSKTMFAGNLLAFVIPMMPYVVGLMCVAGYYLLIFEAIFGAPLLVVAMLFPDQDGIVGKQGQGYMLVLNVCLRPILNVAGYCGSFLMTSILFDMLNSTFFTAASNTEGGLLGINKSLTMIILYASTMISLQLMCLKLLHAIPDTLFKWIGGATSSLLGMVSGQSDSSAAKAMAAGGAGAAMMSSAMSPRFEKPRTKPTETKPKVPSNDDPKATEGSNNKSEINTPQPSNPKGDSGQDINDFDI
ncbi:TPA: DotA/TraY family protein [Yersinia enterocolitica]|nr:DotA/TraY family protein [Yersinia enterocolitica]